ncbi:unnamed protein product [Effrenium voratum]|nr:unnamed protein product [Effrenium voratum]
MGRASQLFLTLPLPALAFRTATSLAAQQGGGVEQHAIPHDRLVMVVYPAMAVAACLFLALIITALTSAQQQREEKTGRGSLKDHPLLQRAGAEDAVRELHPETSLVEDFRKAFSIPRMVAFVLATVLACALAVRADIRLFATKHSLASVTTLDACLTACSETPRALCDSAHLSFEPLYCDLHGLHCAPDKSGAHDVESAHCSFTQAPEAWKVDFVLISAITGVFLIVEGKPPELILFGLNAVYGVLGIIDAKQVWAGLGSSSVVGLALLFPVAAAIEETGVLDVAISAMLGNPQSFHIAFFRMLIPVGLLSALLSNTAIVTMMIPVIVSWSRTLDVHPGKLLMPLSFSAMLGGSCTLIGSSHCLVARESVDKSLYEMSFFDLSYSGTVLALATFIVMDLLLPFLSSSAGCAETETSDAPAPDDGNLYSVNFSVRPRGTYAGADSEIVCAQLKRLPGVKAVTTVDGPLEENEQLACRVDETGVISLRQVKGLRIDHEDALRALGMQRERRHLYEAIPSPSSTITNVPFDFDVFRTALGACPLAIRGKDSDIPKAGDVVLLEADERYVESKLWQEEFSITKMVANSSPQRVGGVHDQLRCVMVCLGMAVLVVMLTAEIVDLACGAGLLVLLLVLSNAYSMESVYKAIKGPVLLTIAGAYGLSTALRATGIAMFAAQQLTQLAMPFGTLGVRTAVYFLSAFLSMFMNNSATVAIVGPMLATMTSDMCDADDITCKKNNVKALTHVMVFAAGTCLTSPLGYQTNLMVMKDGGYSFGDFAKYGSLIQVFHMLCSVGVVFLFVDVLGI